MHARLNGGRLSWNETGGASERTIVLVHGFPFHSEIWGPQLESPPPGWRVIAPDLRGFGASELTHSKQTMDAYAEDLAALLQHLGIKGTVLCGMSMGGYVTFAFLRRYAPMARGIVLYATKAGADSPEARAGRTQLIARLNEEGIEALVDSMLPRLLSRTSRGTEVEEHVRAIIQDTPVESAVAATQAMLERPDSTPLLRSLGAVPTQVIVGADDVITPPGEARLMASAIPSAFLEVIPDAGHLSNLEQPRTFNGVLHRFLAGMP